MRWLTFLLLTVACTSDPSPSGPDVESHITSFELPAMVAPKIDLIVAVDNTMPIEAYATQLASLADALAAGPPRDIHFLLTTTTTYEALYSEPHFFAPPTQNFGTLLESAIPYAFMFPKTNAAAPVLLSFMKTQVTSLGSFLRDDAYLGVLIVTASDDASPAADYAGWLKSLKAEPSHILVAAIAPSSAPNIDALVAAFPDRSARLAISDSDWTPAAEFLRSFYKTTLGVLCMPEPLDLLPDVEGEQLDCSISAFDEVALEHVLPACDSTAKPCWSIVRDPQACFEPEPATLKLGGGFAWAYHPAIRGQCVTQ